MGSKQLEILEEIQNIPCAPFLTLKIQDYIGKKLESSERDFVNNGYLIYSNYPRNTGRRKLVIVGHTDHPGAVMKNSKEGILFGSPGIDRLRRQIHLENGISYKVFSPSGAHIGKTKLVQIKADNKTGVFESDIEIPKNSHAQYNLDPYFKREKGNLTMYNADDGVAFATMLSLLSEDLESEYDVYWVF